MLPAEEITCNACKSHKVRICFQTSYGYVEYDQNGMLVQDDNGKRTQEVFDKRRFTIARINESHFDKMTMKCLECNSVNDSTIKFGDGKKVNARESSESNMWDLINQHMVQVS